MTGLFEQVKLTCEARVAGQTITVVQYMSTVHWHDSGARAAMEEHLRRALMDEILKHWKPVVRVLR